MTLVTLPGGRTIAYTYDPAGNRVQVVDSLLGTTTSTTNSVVLTITTVIGFDTFINMLQANVIGY